jgi:hypothetical protein
VKKGLREEQMLTFQALLVILFPHPFHKRQKLQDRNFNSHKKLRQQLEALTKQPKLRRPLTSSRTIDKHRTRRNSNTYRPPTQNIKACALIEGYLFSSHSQTMLTSGHAVTAYSPRGLVVEELYNLSPPTLEKNLLVSSGELGRRRELNHSAGSRSLIAVSAARFAGPIAMVVTGTFSTRA